MQDVSSDDEVWFAKLTEILNLFSGTPVLSDTLFPSIDTKQR